MGFEYIRETGGILKVVEEVLNFIFFICIVSKSGIPERGEAAIAGSIIGFIITGIILIFYLLDIKDKIEIPWHKVECVYCFIMFIFNIVTASLCIDLSWWLGLISTSYYNAYVAGGVFGIFASLVYLVETYYHFRHFNV